MRSVSLVSIRQYQNPSASQALSMRIHEKSSPAVAGPRSPVDACHVRRSSRTGFRPGEVRQRRLKLGKSQEELAGLAGVTQGTISGIESGETKNPQPGTLARIRRTLEALERDQTIAADELPSLPIFREACKRFGLRPDDGLMVAAQWLIATKGGRAGPGEAGRGGDDRDTGT